MKRFLCCSSPKVFGHSATCDKPKPERVGVFGQWGYVNIQGTDTGATIRLSALEAISLAQQMLSLAESYVDPDYLPKTNAANLALLDILTSLECRDPTTSIDPQ